MQFLHLIAALAAATIAPVAADGSSTTITLSNGLSNTVTLPAMPTPPAESKPLATAETTCTTEITAVEPHTSTLITTFSSTTEYNITATLSTSGPSVVATAGVSALSVQKSVVGLVAFCAMGWFVL